VGDLRGAIALSVSRAGAVRHIPTGLLEILMNINPHTPHFVVPP